MAVAIVLYKRKKAENVLGKLQIKVKISFLILTEMAHYLEQGIRGSDTDNGDIDKSKDDAEVVHLIK